MLLRKTPNIFSLLVILGMKFIVLIVPETELYKKSSIIFINDAKISVFF